MLPEADLRLEGRGVEGWSIAHAVIREEISSLYEATLIVTSESRDADPAPLLGRSVTVCVERSGHAHHLRGVVRALHDLGATATHRYARLHLVPWLYTLSQRSDSRIFQDMPVVDIVRAVLSSAGVYEGTRGRLVASDELRALPRREYCVQYRERDLDFVLRLLQEEGIPFYFRHEGEGGETLVLAEDGHPWEPPSLLEAGDAVLVSDTLAATSAVETVQSFDASLALRPTSTTLREFDFTRPRLHLGAGTTASAGPVGERALYDYPARAALHGYDDAGHAFTGYDGNRQARIRHEAEAMGGASTQGRGNVTGFRPGVRVRVSGHHAPARDGRYLLTAVEHRYQAWSDLPEDVRASERISQALEASGLRVTRGRELANRYENRFTAIAAGSAYRPSRVTPRPLVYGTQTATVVGPVGEEIHVDFHGRIRVQFHWDREGQHDDESSCWIRCSQGWSGPGWGFQFIPRIGMEVVVTFLEGDPDRPLVTGCVYNGENRHPYGLPAEKTRSTIKTNSSPTTGGYNELRFEDAAGEEQIYVQAERNHDTLVKNDQTLTVGSNRTKLVEGNERNTIVLDRSTTVQGNESKEVLGNHEARVLGLSGATLTIDHSYHVSADDSLTLKVGDTTIVMTPSELHLHSRTVKVYGDKLVDIKGGLVKINCPEENLLNAPKKKESRLERLVARMRDKLRRLMDRLPRALRAALSKIMKDGLAGVKNALMHGRLPDLAALGRAALGTALGQARGVAMQALGASMRAVAATPGLRDIPGIGGIVSGLQTQAARHVGRGLDALGGFLGGVAHQPAWQQTQREHPQVAQQIMGAVAGRAMRDGMAGLRISGAAGPHGLALFDATGRAGRGALRESAAVLSP